MISCFTTTFSLLGPAALCGGTVLDASADFGRGAAEIAAAGTVVEDDAAEDAAVEDAIVEDDVAGLEREVP